MDIDEDRLTERRAKWTDRDDEPPAPRSQSALIYLLGMLAATACGSAFVAGGMLAGADGFGAILLAGAVPAAALLWALALAKLQRPGEGNRWPDESDPRQDFYR